ncbi:MAG: hypothetical protein Q7J32_08225 [Sphingomonadaceae bacterium]|nr:hypothetical protein [Sphingomonadaceae bacterium]
MRTIIFAAALACSTAAFAQTDDMATTTAAPAPAPTVEAGATTKIIAVGEHYTVHRVMPDGTVMVQTLTGEQAKLAMAGELTPQLATANYGVTQGAGTVTPQ